MRPYRLSGITPRDAQNCRADSGKSHHRTEHTQHDAAVGHGAFVLPLRDGGHDQSHADEHGDNSEDGFEGLFHGFSCEGWI